VGCLALLVAAVAVIVGLAFMPTIVTVTGDTDASWTQMDALIKLMPFAFLILIIIGAIWTVLKVRGGR